VLTAVAQTILASAAGVVLFVIWRRTIQWDRVAGLFITAGFLIRALSGQALFWISYLKLPFAMPLQGGRGFWSLAADAERYFDISASLVFAGARSVIFVKPELSSPAFLQLAALGVALFGFVPSVGVLLNAFAFLGTTAIMVRLARANDPPSRPALVGIAAFCFAPGLICWSTQLLKDPLVHFLMAAFVGGLVVFQDTTMERARGATRRILTACATMALALTMIAGIRPYLSFVFWGTTLLLYFVTRLYTRSRRLATVAALVLLVVAAQLILAASGSYLPADARFVLRPSSENDQARRSGPGTLQTLEDTRRILQDAGGKSVIRSGRNLPEYRDGGSDPERGAVHSPARPVTSDATSLPWLSQFAMITLRGVVAMIFPRAFASMAGLIEIGGGSRFWIVAEIDTLIFDVVLLLALFVVIRALASGRRRRNFALWLVMLATAVMVVLFSYTIPNYGTLFRHRAMVFTGLCLILCVDKRRALPGGAHGEEAALLPADPPRAILRPWRRDVPQDADHSKRATCSSALHMGRRIISGNVAHSPSDTALRPQSTVEDRRMTPSPSLTLQTAQIVAPGNTEEMVVIPVLPLVPMSNAMDFAACTVPRFQTPAGMGALDVTGLAPSSAIAASTEHASPQRPGSGPPRGGK
jgi:hypothetical protein